MVDAVGSRAMKDQIRTLLNNINLDEVTRKYHDKCLYEIACHFRSLRSVHHKQVLVE